MRKELNIPVLKDLMEVKGLSQSDIADRLNVSREAVSKWFRGDSFPRPAKVLALGRLLNLSVDNLIVREDESAPVVAFRKVKGYKTKAAHFHNGETMGKYLQCLSEYLPTRNRQPAFFKNASTDYVFLQSASLEVRQDMSLDAEEHVDFTDLIAIFKDLQATLIPVLWGDKDRHENAMHVYLPESMSTWVYLNLDVNIHDFKFWMSHELGHVFTPYLRGDAAEDFADAFAGALLYPETMASKAYDQLIGKAPAVAINKLKLLAKEAMIAPYSIYKEVNNYADHYDLPPLVLKSIFGANTNFNKAYKNLSNALMHDGEIDPSDYMRLVKEEFESDFYTYLKTYLADSDAGAGFIKTLLDVNLLDAKGIYTELI